MKLTWTSLKTIEKVMFSAFIFYMFSGFLSYINVEDSHEYIKQMDRYIRFALIVPIALAVINSKLDFEKYFFIGMILSGPVFLYFALLSLQQKPDWPAGGAYHHITFGDAAMLNALLIMLMLVLERWKLRWKMLAMISILCCLYASVLSQARGAWIALPIGLLIVFIALTRETRFKSGHALIILVIFALGVFITPAAKMINDRYTEAVSEVEMFIDSGDATTSIGGRLALWSLSIKVWQSSPVIGTGPGDFDNEVMEYQSKGIYTDMDVHSSVHNIYLQSLANTGLLGFFVLMFALLILPFWCFFNFTRKGVKSGYYGLMLISAFAVFGVTESWVLRAPVVSIYIVYLIVLLSLSRKKLNSFE